MNRSKHLIFPWGEEQLSIKCPGCKCRHNVIVKNGAPLWQWNGNEELPTLSPSILCEPDKPEMRCHSFVTDGKIQFLNDCFHHLAGQTVDLPELE